MPTPNTTTDLSSHLARFIESGDAASRAAIASCLADNKFSIKSINQLLTPLDDEQRSCFTMPTLRFFARPMVSYNSLASSLARANPKIVALIYREALGQRSSIDEKTMTTLFQAAEAVILPANNSIIYYYGSENYQFFKKFLGDIYREEDLLKTPKSIVLAVVHNLNNSELLRQFYDSICLDDKRGYLPKRGANGAISFVPLFDVEEFKSKEKFRESVVEVVNQRLAQEPSGELSRGLVSGLSRAIENYFCKELNYQEIQSDYKEREYYRLDHSLSAEPEPRTLAAAKIKSYKRLPAEIFAKAFDEFFTPEQKKDYEKYKDVPYNLERYEYKSRKARQGAYKEVINLVNSLKHEAEKQQGRKLPPLSCYR